MSGVRPEPNNFTLAPRKYAAQRREAHASYSAEGIPRRPAARKTLAGIRGNPNGQYKNTGSYSLRIPICERNA